MALAALDAVDDAFEATRRFLAPFDRVRWFRLAAVAFFLGGLPVAAPNFFQFTAGPSLDEPEPTPGGPQPTPGDVDPGQFVPELTPLLLALIVGVAALAIVLAVLWSVTGAAMEFVLVRSLGSDDVALWEYLTAEWRRGVRLFAFRAVGWLGSLAVVAAITLGVGTALGGWPPTGWEGGAILGALLVGVPLAALAVFLVGTLMGFTTVFVVPVMLVEDLGVVAAWRRFWPTLFGEWQEYLVYLVVGFLLSVGVGIATGFLSLIAVVVLAIPFAVVAIPAALLLGVGTLGGTILLVLAFAFVLLAFVTLLLIKVPFLVFLRYYALFVLGDTNEAFDVIPDTRAAVRSPPAGYGPGSGREPGDDDRTDRGGPGGFDNAGSESGDDPDDGAAGDGFEPSGDEGSERSGERDGDRDDRD